MRLHTSPSSAASWRSLLLSTLLFTRGWGKKEAPGIKSSTFDFLPKDVSYFEDSDVVVFGGDNDMYRSEDAGESWNIVTGPPKKELAEIQLHPFDPTRGYYIGQDFKHWLTTDRGKTWQEFKTPAIASMFRRAMDFHAGDPDRVIFNAMDCESIFCEEVVSHPMLLRL